MSTPRSATRRTIAWRTVASGLLLMISDLAIAQAPIEPFTQLQKFDGGGDHSCALQEGRLWCWGKNLTGQIGDGTQFDRSLPTRIEALRNVTDFALGADFTCAVAGGGVYCWGGNTNGQLGDGGPLKQTLPTAVAGLESGFARVIAGDDFACAITPAGAVTCWGASAEGQTGINAGDTVLPAQVPVVVATGAIAAGAGHVCFVDAAGEVYCWGDNSHWQLATDQVLYSVSLRQVLDLGQSAIAVSLGESHSCAVLQDATVRCWGANDVRQLGNGLLVDSASPVQVNGLPDAVSQLVSGASHNCAAMQAGGAMCWGGGNSGQLGDATVRTNTITPVEVLDSAGLITVLGSGSDHACAELAGQPLRCWGNNGSGQLGDGSNRQHLHPTAVVGAGSGAIRLATGTYNSCALGGAGGLRCWGAASSGMLGTGDATVPALTPNSVSTLGNGIKAVSVGSNQTCAVDASDDLYCWGYVVFGEASGGGATYIRYTLPTAVSGLPGPVASVAVGSAHTCAVLQNGSVWCWGVNDSGQLGDGSTDLSVSPIEVIPASEPVQSVVAGLAYTCALGATGTVRCWGRNSKGQLGDGSTTQRELPTPVVGLPAGVTQITAGREHACARVADGSLYCWGKGSDGQLGNNDTLDSSVPQAVDSVLQFSSVAAGGFHTCAITAGSAVWCWGRGDYGQLGTGGNSQSLVPGGSVTLTNDIQLISAGNLHTCAVSSSAGLRCWGSNEEGQLGDGTAGKRAFPADVIHVPIEIHRNGFEALP